MVGDNPLSDIKGANAVGWKTVLVRTGMFNSPDENDSQNPANLVVENVTVAVPAALKDYQKLMKKDVKLATGRDIIMETNQMMAPNNIRTDLDPESAPILENKKDIVSEPVVEANTLNTSPSSPLPSPVTTSLPLSIPSEPICIASLPGTTTSMKASEALGALEGEQVQRPIATAGPCVGGLLARKRQEGDKAKLDAFKKHIRRQLQRLNVSQEQVQQKIMLKKLKQNQHQPSSPQSQLQAQALQSSLQLPTQPAQKLGQNENPDLEQERKV